ncbi:MAG: phenylacetic acid degradation bifunctional protein PaaZ, partial [Flavobacteriales bacterium]
MKKLGNLVEDRWIEGTGEGTTLYNAINGVPIASASTGGIDIHSMYDYARSKGGFALRKMTFQERGIMLKKLALHLHSIKNKFYIVSAETGATKTDSWI